MSHNPWRSWVLGYIHRQPTLLSPTTTSHARSLCYCWWSMVPFFYFLFFCHKMASVAFWSAVVDGVGDEPRGLYCLLTIAVRRFGRHRIGSQSIRDRSSFWSVYSCLLCNLYLENSRSHRRRQLMMREFSSSVAQPIGVVTCKEENHNRSPCRGGLRRGGSDA